MEGVLCQKWKPKKVVIKKLLFSYKVTSGLPCVFEAGQGFGDCCKLACGFRFRLQAEFRFLLQGHGGPEFGVGSSGSFSPKPTLCQVLDRPDLSKRNVLRFRSKSRRASVEVGILVQELRFWV